LVKELKRLGSLEQPDFSLYLAEGLIVSRGLDLFALLASADGQSEGLVVEGGDVAFEELKHLNYYYYNRPE
jgi:hypothetical protein